MLAKGIKEVRAHLASLPSQDDVSLEKKRSFYDKAVTLFELPTGIEVTPTDLGGIPAEWHRPVISDPPIFDSGHVVLYLHGGGYAMGSPRSHRHMVAAIALACRAQAVAIDYRLAPEAPFPGAVEDALDAYRGLLDRGFNPTCITIAGDSAGGGLTVALLLAIKEAGLPRPAAGVCISPWVDLSNAAQSYQTKAGVDPMVKLADTMHYAALYLGEASPENPLASPVMGNLQELAPLLIQVGSDEVLIDDADQLANRAREAGVEVVFEVWDKMIHVWHWFGHYLDEAGEATQRIGEFVRAHTGRPLNN